MQLKGRLSHVGTTASPAQQHLPELRVGYSLAMRAKVIMDKHLSVFEAPSDVLSSRRFSHICIRDVYTVTIDVTSDLCAAKLG